MKRKVQCAICGRTATVEIDDEAKEIKSELRVTGDGGLLGEVKLTNGGSRGVLGTPKMFD